MNRQIGAESAEKFSNKLDDLKLKFKEETGFDIAQYNIMDKGELTSRQNGYVGGYIGGSMTKKLVNMAEQQMEGDKKVKKQ